MGIIASFSSMAWLETEKRPGRPKKHRHRGLMPFSHPWFPTRTSYVWIRCIRGRVAGIGVTESHPGSPIAFADGAFEMARAKWKNSTSKARWFRASYHLMQPLIDTGRADHHFRLPQPRRIGLPRCQHVSWVPSSSSFLSIGSFCLVYSFPLHRFLPLGIALGFDYIKRTTRAAPQQYPPLDTRHYVP